MSIVLIFLIFLVMYAIIGYHCITLDKQIKRGLLEIIELKSKVKMEVENNKNNMLEAKTWKEKALENSQQDPLTGLPSRQLFNDRLAQTLNQSKRHKLLFALLLVNIDGFKLINDSIGFDEGDELLEAIGKRLQSSIRQMDSIMRQIGNSFVVLHPHITKPESAAYSAQRLLGVLSESFKIKTHEVNLTASIGIAIYPADGQDAPSLLKNAESALQGCRQNSFQYYRREIHASSQRELVISEAFAKESVFEELTLFYKTRTNINNDVIVGVDTILRWYHRKVGWVEASEIYQFAEKHSNTATVCEWMIRSACVQFKVWEREGRSIENIMLSLPFKLLANSHFIFSMADILKYYDITPSSIIIEISEIILASEMSVFEKVTLRLKNLGVHVALGGFGSGNIPLLFLKNSIFNYIILSSSLIQDFFINKDSEAIVRAMILLLKQLNAKIVVSSLDSLHQKKIFSELGCNYLIDSHYKKSLIKNEISR